METIEARGLNLKRKYNLPTWEADNLVVLSPRLISQFVCEKNCQLMFTI